jgi:hypothetical protein
MFSKLSEAIQLLLNNFLLISMLILTVWLPGNLLVNYLLFFVSEPDSLLTATRVPIWIEGIFGPIYIGAMIHALWQIKQGQTVRYREAIATGFKNWGPLLANRIVAGLFIALGLVAFIVPGVILALRYALLDSVVIIEGQGSSAARRRSTELTEGIRQQLFGLVLLFYIAFIFASMVIYTPIGLIEQSGGFSTPVMMAMEVIADCVLDLVYAVLQIAVFLYYWDRRQAELAANQDGDWEAGGDEDSASAAGRFAMDYTDNDNPYHSPLE